MLITAISQKPSLSTNPSRTVNTPRGQMAFSSASKGLNLLLFCFKFKILAAMSLFNLSAFSGLIDIEIVSSPKSTCVFWHAATIVLQTLINDRLKVLVYRRVIFVSLLASKRVNLM